MKTPAQRKADERARMRAAGFVLYQAWVHPLDMEKVKRYIAQTRRARG